MPVHCDAFRLRLGEAEPSPELSAAVAIQRAADAERERASSASDPSNSAGSEFSLEDELNAQLPAMDTVDLRVTRTVHNTGTAAAFPDVNADSGLETEETCAECSLANSNPARLHSNCVHIPSSELGSAAARVPLVSQSSIQSILNARHHCVCVPVEQRSCPCCSILGSLVGIDANLIESARVGCEKRLENSLRASLTPSAGLASHLGSASASHAAPAPPSKNERSSQLRGDCDPRGGSADQPDCSSAAAAAAASEGLSHSCAESGAACAPGGVQCVSASLDRGDRDRSRLAATDPRGELVRKCYSNDLELSHERELVRSEPLEIARIRRLLLTQVRVHSLFA